MHVLVPIKGVVPMPLTDIAQAVADSLGGGEATRLSMERFCKTLESVFRTEFSVKVDRANASLVLGGRRYGNAFSRSSSRVVGSGGGGGGGSGGLLVPPQAQAGQTAVEAGPPGAREGGSKDDAPAGAVSVAGQDNAINGDKSKRSKWKMALRRGKKSDGAAGGNKGDDAPAPAALAVEGGRVLGRRGGAGKKRSSNGGGEGASTDEAAVVPLLQLVEELVQNAMFSPIGARDVMMSQVEWSVCSPGRVDWTSSSEGAMMYSMLCGSASCFYVSVYCGTANIRLLCRPDFLCNGQRRRVRTGTR